MPCSDARREPIVRRVVLLGPAHRVALGGLAAPNAEAFETPLGEVALDLAALAGLDDLPQVVRSDRAHEHEHSLEVQLPFLQTQLGSFTLVPLVVGDADAEAVAQVLERLWGGDETLIVISSDLSHYLRYEQARAADRATVQRILALDAGLGPHEACGAAAINGALLAARRHRLAPRLLALRNSGDTAGDRDRVVGYGAIAFEEACSGESASGALVASARRWPHPVRPVPARLPAARGPARHVLRAPARRRRDGAHHLRAQLGLLHRPDREEAAQPLLPRQQRALSFGTAGCNLACKFCQNWDISKSREMDRLIDAASPRAHRRGGARERRRERGLHLQRPGDLRRVRDGHGRRLPRARPAQRRGDGGLHARRSRGASSTRGWTRPTST